MSGRPGSRARRDAGAVARILVWTIAGYPLLGMLVAYTSAPSFAASIPVRLIVLATSVWLLIRLPQSPARGWGRLLLVFWAIYGLRLAADLAAGVPGTPFDVLFFGATALLPALAVSRVPCQRWDEDRIARSLAAFGLVTAGAALLTTVLPFAQDRSLLEQTGRLSFDTVNPITLGHIAVSTLIAISVLVGRRGIRAAPWLLGVPLALALLQAGASRGPVVALAGVGLAWIFFSQGSARRFIVLGAVALLALGSLGVIAADSELVRRFDAIEEDKSTAERLLMQGNAIQQFLDHPWTGSAHVELESLTYPHNVVIESAMATGVVGATLCIALTLGMLLSIAARLRRGERIVPLLGMQYLINAQLSGSLFASSALWVLTAMMLAAPSIAPAPRKGSAVPQ
jgi:O-antigen ligase